MSERLLVRDIAYYLKMQYPGIVYRFDLAADLKLTMGQARRHKDIHGQRGYPDLFIAKPVYNAKEDKNYHGCFIELKREGTTIFKKDGTIRADSHLKEQAEFLSKLRECGYMAEFAVGFDHTKSLIDYYLNSDRVSYIGGASV